VQTPPWGHTPWCKKLVIYPDPCRETSEDAVHGSKVYSAGVDLKGLALPRFSVIKKNFKKKRKKEENKKLKGVALLMTCLVGEGTWMYVEALVGKGYEKEKSNFD
jgi:hypothetical protein